MKFPFGAKCNLCGELIAGEIEAHACPPMEHKGAEFARAENGELRGQHVRWLICGDQQVKAWTLDQWAPEEMAKIINAAHRRAVEEAVRKTRAEYICQEHGKMLLRCLSCEEEAESRVWEAVFKESCTFCDSGWAVEGFDGKWYHRVPPENLPTIEKNAKCHASALRSKAASS